jgi:SPP1 family predicted phage head-tail adaptor
VSEPRPSIGMLTDRIAFARKETTAEPEGGQGLVFVPVATLWGRVRTVSSRHSVDADARGVTISHMVVLRFRTDIAPGDRLSVRGRQLFVERAEDIDGRRAFLACACSETQITG